jgi:NAD(P) transhydrogenase
LTLAPDTSDYDLIAIGSGPAGQRAALEAARLGRRVAIAEREGELGGVTTNSGTLPSRMVRAAIIELSGQAHGIYASARRLKHEITVDDLFWRSQQVIERERDSIRDRLRRSSVDLLAGDASFVDPHTVEVRSANETRRLGAGRFVIAVGTRPVRPAGVDFDGRTVLDADGILGLSHVPRTLTVVGGGVIGLEYASMIAALGVRVTVVEKHEPLLDFVDDEIVEALQYHLRGLGMAFLLGDEVVSVQRRDAGEPLIRLGNGSRFTSQIVIYAGSRAGATESLNLAAAGLEADARGRIPVGADYRTAQAHIFAAGDVVGSSGVAATPAEQGRLAALAAFGEPAGPVPALVPIGLNTIPEISFVGQREHELTEAGRPYVAGLARYRELPCGEIAGERCGLLKLLVHAESRRLLGVHIFGTAAMELVHVGQTVIAAGLTVDYLVRAVFNMVTFSDAYRVAALDACSRLEENGQPKANAA